MKSWTLLGAAVLASLAAGPAWPQDKNEAQELYGKMEKALTEAKTLQFSIEETISGNEKDTFKGTVILAEEGKARYEIDMVGNGKSSHRVSVSDGSKLRVTIDGESNETRSPNLRRVLLSWLTLAGHTGWSLSMDYTSVSEPDPKKAVQLSGFTLGKKEKVGDQEAQAIEYVAKVAGSDMAVSVTLWLATKSGLPLKRTVAYKMKDREYKVTELYSNIKVDEKLDPEQFKLKDDK